MEIILNILSLYPSKMLVTCGYEYQKYSLVMEYDNMHNILGKTQVHKTSPDNTNWTKAHQTTYDLTYEKYNAAEFNVAGYSYTQPHAVRQIIDKPEATSTGNDVKTKTYDYDANGNLTAITQKTGESDVVEKLRTNLWDEENRLRAVDITPDAEGVRPIAIYTYDAGGERILKHSNTSVSIYLNGKKVADTIQTDATIYPSGMLVARLGNNGSEETLAYTKHYYAGAQRVSSKIGTTENLGNYLYDWFTQGTGGPVDVIGSSFGVLENAEQGVVQVYDEFEIDPPTYESTPVFIPVQSFVHGTNENEVYWFHPDHLGSTSYITNLLGEVSQHMEYFAFGETFVEEHRSSNNSPYKFNGKELDEETGWYYYGARYYDPRISVWLSVDPLANVDYLMNDEAYINGEHNGGVFNSFNHNSYAYTYQNPLRFIDPNGKQIDVYNAGFTDSGQLWIGFNSTIAHWRTPMKTILGSHWIDMPKGYILHIGFDEFIIPNGSPKVVYDYAKDVDWDYFYDTHNVRFKTLERPRTLGEIEDNLDAWGNVTDMAGSVMVSLGVLRASKIKLNASKTIHQGQQGKHIMGHNNYKRGKSILKEDAQMLLNDAHAGRVKSIQTINKDKTRVDFGKVIGDYVEDGVSMPTTKGIIHNSKNGAHIVPAKP